MAANIVLDACAVIAMLTSEPGGDVVEMMIADHRGRAFMHSINVFEVAYKLMKKNYPLKTAWAMSRPFGVAPIRNCDPSPLTYRASDIKTQYQHLSLGDCFALALAESLNAEFITSDGGFRDCETTAAIAFFR